jgi:hypothetical protein
MRDADTGCCFYQRKATTPRGKRFYRGAVIARPNGIGYDDDWILLGPNPRHLLDLGLFSTRFAQPKGGAITKRPLYLGAI